MKINGVELIFDATDADTLDKYLTAVDECSKANAAIKPAGGNQEETIRMYREICGTIKKVFDDIFGEGTGEKVCGKNDSVKTCSEAYISLMEEYNRQHEEQQKRNAVLASFTEKYAAD